MRVFFAIEFDNETKGYIKDIQEIVKENSIKGNFSHEENFHLTLRFIGEVNEVDVEKLKNSLNIAVEKSKPFEIEFTKLGFFARGNKKIVWLGLRNEDGKLMELFRSLEEALKENGYESEEKGYRPHITLSRETLLKEDFEREFNRVKIKERKVKISKVSLMESKRVDGRLRYIPIYVKEIGEE